MGLRERLLKREQVHKQTEVPDYPEALQVKGECGSRVYTKAKAAEELVKGNHGRTIKSKFGRGPGIQFIGKACYKTAVSLLLITTLDEISPSRT